MFEQWLYFESNCFLSFAGDFRYFYFVQIKGTTVFSKIPFACNNHRHEIRKLVFSN